MHFERGPGRGKQTGCPPRAGRALGSAARRAQGLRCPPSSGGCAAHCTRAPSHQALFPAPPCPAPKRARVPGVGGATVARGSQPRPIFRPSFQAQLPARRRGPAIPPLPASATARAPTAPSPRARVTAAQAPECVAWRRLRERSVFGRESGLRASQEARAGGLPRRPGTCCRCLLSRPGLGGLPWMRRRPRETLGENFANFAVGAGEAARLNGRGDHGLRRAGRAPGLARAPGSGPVRPAGGHRALRASPPHRLDSARCPGSPRDSLVRSAPGNGLDRETWLWPRVILFFFSSAGSVFPHLTSLPRLPLFFPVARTFCLLDF
nr:translation initiation factor IF-2 [Oryctolagus cuniculus]